MRDIVHIEIQVFYLFYSNNRNICIKMDDKNIDILNKYKYD